MIENIPIMKDLFLVLKFVYNWLYNIFFPIKLEVLHSNNGGTGSNQIQLSKSTTANDFDFTFKPYISSNKILGLITYKVRVEIPIEFSKPAGCQVDDTGHFYDIKNSDTILKSLNKIPNLDFKNLRISNPTLDTYEIKWRINTEKNGDFNGKILVKIIK
jgi:hypothetical protein